MKQYILPISVLPIAVVVSVFLNMGVAYLQEGSAQENTNEIELLTPEDRETVTIVENTNELAASTPEDSEAVTIVRDINTAKVPTSKNNEIVTIVENNNEIALSTSENSENVTIVGTLPNGVHGDLHSASMVSHNGSLYIVAFDYSEFSRDFNEQLWRLDPENPAGQSDFLGYLPSGLTLAFLTSHNGELYAVDRNYGKLWQINISDPESSRELGDLPSELEDVIAIGSYNGNLYVAANIYPVDQLWEINLDNLSKSRSLGDLPGYLIDSFGMFPHNGGLYVTDSIDNQLFQINTNRPESSSLFGDLLSNSHAIYSIASHNGYFYLVAADYSNYDYSDDSINQDSPVKQLFKINPERLEKNSKLLTIDEVQGVNYRPSDPYTTSHNGHIYTLSHLGGGFYDLMKMDSNGGTVIEGLPVKWLDSITSHNGGLYMVDNLDNKLWLIDLVNPENSTIVGDLPFDFQEGIFSYNGELYIVVIHDYGNRSESEKVYKINL